MHVCTSCTYMYLSRIHPKLQHQLPLGVQKYMQPLWCDGVTCCASQSTQFDAILYRSGLGRRNPLSSEVFQIQLHLIKLVSCLLWIPTCNSRTCRHRDYFRWMNLHSVSGWDNHITWSKIWGHFTIDLASYPVLLCHHLPSTVQGYRCQRSF